MRLVYALLLGAFLFITILYFVPMPQKVNDYFLAHLEEIYGNKACNHQLEKSIRYLADKHGIDNNSFVIRCANTKAMATFSYANAVVVPCSLSWLLISYHKYIIFLSENFMQELSAEQQEFLITHELMHIKNNDPQTANYSIFSLYILLMLLLTIIYQVSEKYIQKYSFAQYYRIAALIIIGYSAMIAIFMWRGVYSKFFERRADVQACIYLGTTQGGISFVNHLHKMYIKTPLKTDVFATHPSNQDRIIYLQQLQTIYKSSGNNL